MVGGTLLLGCIHYAKEGAIHSFLDSFYAQAEEYKWEDVTYKKRVWRN